jgi:hypothetical protein
MKPFSLATDAYVFWTAVSEIRRDWRLGIPADDEAFVEEMNVIHDMTDYAQIKLRCVDALIAMNERRGPKLLKGPVA